MKRMTWLAIVCLVVLVGCEDDPTPKTHLVADVVIVTSVGVDTMFAIPEFKLLNGRGTGNFINPITRGGGTFQDQTLVGYEVQGYGTFPVGIEMWPVNVRRVER